MQERKKDTAVVTGASSGIGLAISRKLVDMGYEVFGLGRNFVDPGPMAPSGMSVDPEMQAPSGMNVDPDSMAPSGMSVDPEMQAPSGMNVDSGPMAPSGMSGNPEMQALPGMNVDSDSMAPSGMSGDSDPWALAGTSGTMEGAGTNEREAIRQQEGFHPVVCDVLDTEKLCRTVKEIARNNHVRLLVNNAGVGYYGLHEEQNPKKISEMVRTNLEVPMILAQQLLRQLKKNKGTIINIVSVTAGTSNPHGCAYGASKAGLASFSRSLFDEVRKYGVKVVSIFPDMTKTNLYRSADFREGEEAESYLLPEEVADAAAYILSRRDGAVVSDITLKPQIHRIRRTGHAVKNKFRQGGE